MQGAISFAGAVRVASRREGDRVSYCLSFGRVDFEEDGAIAQSAAQSCDRVVIQFWSEGANEHVLLA